MSNSKHKKKTYEPPLIREIGGVFEQAMGVSACNTGQFFTTDPCANGTSASGGCNRGQYDQACTGGGSDGGSCSRGFFASGGCTNGTGGG
jgi:hypothetical protein